MKQKHAKIIFTIGKYTSKLFILKFWVKVFMYSRKNKKVIKGYIRNQIQEDIVANQLTMKELIGSFSGYRINKQ